MSFTLDRDRLFAGDCVGLTARWRTAAPTAGYFAVWLVPQRGVHGNRPDSWVKPTQTKGRFEQSFPLLYSLRDLSATPPGTVYEQRGLLVAPTNTLRDAAVGAYEAWIAVSAAYPPQFADWQRAAVLHVVRKPYPTNPP